MSTRTLTVCSGITKLNALVGHRLEGTSREEQLQLARETVGWAADRAAEQGAEAMMRR